MILLLMSGEGRSGLPTTAAWRDTATPFSIASTRAAGMLHDDVARAEICGQRLQPLDIDLELIAPRRRRHVHRVERLLRA